MFGNGCVTGWWRGIGSLCWKGSTLIGGGAC